MFDAQNVMQGRKPLAMQEQPDGAELQSAKNTVKTHLIPAKFFRDFAEITPETEPLFEFIAFYVTTSVLEKMEDDKWCLEFPSCISNEGRRILHEVANYFELAHHSQGKDKNRRTLMYPRSQFPDKQEAEKRRLEKEMMKLREKYSGRNFIAEPIEKCKTFREQVMR